MVCFEEDLGLVPSTYMVGHSCRSRGSDAHCLLWAPVYVCVVHVNSHRLHTVFFNRGNMFRAISSQSANFAYVSVLEGDWG